MLPVCHFTHCEHYLTDYDCKEHCIIADELSIEKPVRGKRLSENGVGVILLLLAIALILFVWLYAHDNMTLVLPAGAVAFIIALWVARRG